MTLHQLLHLDTLKGVPDTWPSGNYDYFWIVDFDQDSGTPTGFRMVKQIFDGTYADVPQNGLGRAERAHCR